ncbi:MAG: sensor histidine kinase [Scytolyngbya sp. HA4215-MV1]|jgi:signal transduction histidine kinase|nr:sensor histidine kinase [Scytolyngbya sp. HA4215-MV1]
MILALDFGLKPSSHPLRFLLRLEWILLGIITLSEFFAFRFYALPRLPLLNLLGLGMFALMGLRLPDRPWQKGIYTGLEISLILLVSLVGGIRLFPFLYVVLVIRNCLIFVGSRRTIVATIAYLLCLVTLLHRFRSFTPPRPALLVERSGFAWFSVALLVGLVIFFLQSLVNAVLAERLSRDQLAVANARLRQYALRIEDQATLQERNRIAREIHDSLGHSLTAFNLHLEAALKLLDSAPDEARDLLREAKQIGSTTLQEVRRSVGTLRSDPLQERSLTDAIAHLLEDFRRSTQLSPTYQVAINAPIPPEVQTAAYRIVQEALTNICKYAAATEVEISLRTYPNFQVIVQDNGKGFDLQQNTTGFGLQGMEERTIALAGRFEINTAPGKGCRIVATFPLESGRE